ncbi:MAG: CvpA family protein [Spirochaetes bacterium]|nr:CvpA family protein [Spirochaetota bacterium]
MEIFKIINYFDFFSLLLVLSISITSYFKGFLKKLFSLAYIIASFLFTFFISESIKKFVFSKWGKIYFLVIILFFLVFLFFYLILKLIFNPLLSGYENNANYSWIGGLNRSLGFIVGFVEAFIIIILILILYYKYIKNLQIKFINDIFSSSFSYKLFLRLKDIFIK